MLVSAVLPIDSRRCAESTLRRCLASLRSQTYAPVEVIAVLSREHFHLSAVAQEYGARVFVCDQGKSAARNFGSSRASGTYLLHIDVDMMLDADCIQQCVSAIAQFDALSIGEAIDENSRLKRMRRAERRIADPAIQSPRFVTRDCFEAVGGFDAEVDPIDEGSLKERLLERGYRCGVVPQGITVLDRRSLLEQWYGKFERGQKVPLFNEKYRSSTQLRAMARAQWYGSKWRLLLSDPVAAPLLLLVKSVDLIALKTGSKCAPADVRVRTAELRNLQVFSQEAGSYEFDFYERTKGAKQIAQRERALVQSLLTDLPYGQPRKALDGGCGGGRWSDLLLRTFDDANVVAFDRSDGMVKCIRERFAADKRFSAVEADFVALPFPDDSFDLLLTIRAVKYATSTTAALREFRRVLGGRGVLIVEFPYANVVIRLLRKLPLGKISEYARRAQFHSDEALKSMLSEAGFEVVEWQRAFRLPATFYRSKIFNSKFILALASIFESILPPSFFSRSIFIKAATVERTQ